MAEEQARDNRENIGPVEAYQILLKRNINEDRLLTERTTIYLAASSILFLAFVMLLSQALQRLAAEWVKLLLIILPISGIFLTTVFHFLVTGTIKRLNFLWDTQKRIEKEEPEFNYMRDKDCAPQIFGASQREKENLLVKHASQWCFPITFWVLWKAALTVAIISLLCNS